ncbi:hypothetical protein IKG68_03300 [Candidatus Saccharibacteria bacterium]|nr:hypothetical protein [Candidatus Saccharibacteria bacterium]
MKYLAVLGRNPELSLAELEALFDDVELIAPSLATFSAKYALISRLGGTLKLALPLAVAPLEYLRNTEPGKLTIAISDYSPHTSARSATTEALKLKKILVRHGRSVRVVESNAATLSTATSLYSGLSGTNPRKTEFIKYAKDWYRVVDVQDINAYARRDQARPARDARVGMLPPKLAQILINLCGPLPAGSRILDPFCGTGVVLQEATLMGYIPYGTDTNERMIEYTEKNLAWLTETKKINTPFSVSLGDATSFQWTQPIDAVACEAYLGRPMSTIPPEIKLKTEKQECGAIIKGFLKNLAGQIKPGTPVVIAIPAWLRENGTYSRLEILDEIEHMGYNVSNKTREGLLYHRDGQIVARDIIILRKN